MRKVVIERQFLYSTSRNLKERGGTNRSAMVFKLINGHNAKIREFIAEYNSHPDIVRKGSVILSRVICINYVE